MTQRLFLQKTPAEDREKNEKLPYFRLVLIPAEEGGEWTDLGAFWKAQSGNGYSGKLVEGAVVDIAGVVPFTPGAKTANAGEDTRAVPTPEDD